MGLYSSHKYIYITTHTNKHTHMSSEYYGGTSEEESDTEEYDTEEYERRVSDALKLVAKHDKREAAKLEKEKMQELEEMKNHLLALFVFFEKDEKYVCINGMGERCSGIIKDMLNDM